MDFFYGQVKNKQNRTKFVIFNNHIFILKIKTESLIA